MPDNEGQVLTFDVCDDKQYNLHQWEWIQPTGRNEKRKRKKERRK